MELREILKTLQLEDTYLAAIEPNWDQSEASFPGSIPEFLTPAGYRKKFECTGLDPALLPVLDDISAKIVHNPALLHLAWHCYQSQFFYPDPSFAKWPWFENILGENCTVFYLLVLIAALPLTIKKYQSMGIPEKYAEAICSRTRGYHDTYQAGYNRHGINPGQLYWSRHYTDAVLFRVGRFEYWPMKLDGKYFFEVYKNHKTGKILTLRTSGLIYNQKGYCISGNEDTAPAAFTGKYEKTDEYVIVTPGYIAPETPSGDCDPQRNTPIIVNCHLSGNSLCDATFGNTVSDGAKLRFVNMDLPFNSLDNLTPEIGDVCRHVDGVFIYKATGWFNLSA